MATLPYGILEPENCLPTVSFLGATTDVYSTFHHSYVQRDPPSVAIRSVFPIPNHFHHLPSRHLPTSSPNHQRKGKKHIPEVGFATLAGGYRTLSCGGAGSMPLEFAVFSPDAHFVVTVARDGLVQSWDAVKGECDKTLIDEGHPANIGTCWPGSVVVSNIFIFTPNLGEMIQFD